MLFHFHLTTDQHAPFPPRESLDTIEAPDAQAALERLKLLQVQTAPGVREVWIRVVDTWHEVGGPKHVLSQQVSVTASLN